MSMIVTSMLAGAGVGLSIAAPIGPSAMLCVQRTLAAGLLTGLATGFGIATVHLTYGTLVLLCGTAFAAAWTDTASLLIASGAVLFAFAIRALRRVLVLNEENEQRRKLASSYAGAVGFGFLNPITPIMFAAAIPALLDNGRGAAPLLELVIGMFLGSFGWWVVLSSTVSLLRHRLTCRSLNLANKAAGLMLAALAASMMMKGVRAILDGPATIRPGELTLGTGMAVAPRPAEVAPISP